MKSMEGRKQYRKLPKYQRKLDNFTDIFANNSIVFKHTADILHGNDDDSFIHYLETTLLCSDILYKE